MNVRYQDDTVLLRQADAMALLASLDSASVDLVATDPPYFRVKDEPWDRAWDDAGAFLRFIDDICAEFRRVLKPNGSLYIFASPEMERRVASVVEGHLRVLNVVRWRKEEGWHNKTEREALRSYLSPWEAIVFAEQYADEYAEAEQALHKAVYAPIGRAIATMREAAGISRGDVDTVCAPSEKPMGLCYRWESGDCLPTEDQFAKLCRLTGSTASYEVRIQYEELRRPFDLRPKDQADDIWDFGTVAPYPDKHPCEKPLALMEHIIRASARPGALVLDPFAGSATTLLAARNLGRRAIGGDASEKWTAFGAHRLSQHDLFQGAA